MMNQKHGGTGWTSILPRGIRSRAGRRTDPDRERDLGIRVRNPVIVAPIRDPGTSAGIKRRFQRIELRLKNPRKRRKRKKRNTKARTRRRRRTRRKRRRKRRTEKAKVTTKRSSVLNSNRKTIFKIFLKVNFIFVKSKTEIVEVRQRAPMTKEEWERMERNKKINPLPDTQLNRLVCGIWIFSCTL